MLTCFIVYYGIEVESCDERTGMVTAGYEGRVSGAVSGAQKVLKD